MWGISAALAEKGFGHLEIVSDFVDLDAEFEIFTGMANRVGVVTIVCWLWAGMFAQVLRAGGLVDGLVWLGIRSWRAPADDLAAVKAAPTLFSQGCVLAALNPKTLLFSAAFIPQFVPAGAAAADLALVAAVYLAVVLAGDLLWAAFATTATRLLGGAGQWRNRLTGAFLVIAGVGLALARR